MTTPDDLNLADAAASALGAPLAAKRDAEGASLADAVSRAVRSSGGSTSTRPDAAPAGGSMIELAQRVARAAGAPDDTLPPDAA